MYEKKELGTGECLKAIQAMIQKAQEDGGRDYLHSYPDNFPTNRTVHTEHDVGEREWSEILKKS